MIRFGRWITRDQTFERMVSPAIADMQLEVSQGGSRWRHYLGLCLVLIYAALHDLRLDVSVAFDRESRRVAWKRAGIWYLGSAAVFTFLEFWEEMSRAHTDSGIWAVALTSAVLKAAVTAPGVGIVPAVLFLYRRAPSRRTIVAAVLIAGAVTVIVAMSVRPIRMLADQTLYDDAPNRSQDSYRVQRLDPSTTWWEGVQMGAWVFAHACVGVVLAHGRSVARRVAGVLLTWYLFVAFLLSAEILGTFRSSLIMQRWKDMALVFSVAVVWLVYDALLMWLRRPAVN
jgi:hypothetical protein